VEGCEQDGLTSDYYQIRVRGALAPLWSTWFDGFSITIDTNGDTILAGPVADQAALYGLISRARDLGLTLLSVRRLTALEDKENTSV
jgi:hypothetical protein